MKQTKSTPKLNLLHLINGFAIGGAEKQVLQSINHIDPDSFQLRKNIAITYMNMKDYKQAVLNLEKIPSKERERDKQANGLLMSAKEKLLTKSR